MVHNLGVRHGSDRETHNLVGDFNLKKYVLVKLPSCPELISYQCFCGWKSRNNHHLAMWTFSRNSFSSQLMSDISDRWVSLPIKIWQQKPFKSSLIPRKNSTCFWIILNLNNHSWYIARWGCLMMEWNTSDSKSAALIIEVTGASTNSCRTEKRDWK